MLDIFKKIIGDKKEYKMMMARVDAMPEDYKFVFKKIQQYMWNFASGDGYDMLKIHYDLIELFETGIAEGKSVLEITSTDVASFCDELLRNANTYTENWREVLNREVMNKLGNTEKKK